ncbi:MAG: sigma-70 family RNA polymerase sigma factor [Rikenellaceae bacterium]|nr:sigma-70 family RNA polymerase sigma factor [Rikenellaceae bacterium]
MSTEQETRLIQRAALGDARAWTEIVTSYSGGMYSLAVRMMGCASDAEDVVQESFIKAFGSLGGFRNRSSLSTWLYRITYTTAVSALRRRRDCALFEDGRYDAPDGDIDSEITAQRIEQMTRAIAQLPAGEQALIHLHYTDGLSLTACAEVMGSTEGALKTRLSRIRAKLRTMIEN